MAYRVFVRNWWSQNPDGTLEPSPGTKRTKFITTVEQEAIDYCTNYNKTHKPGKLSRKAEFEEV